MLRRLSQVVCGFFRGYFGYPTRRYRTYYFSLVTPVFVGICLGITLHTLLIEMECTSNHSDNTTSRIQKETEKSIVKRSLNNTQPMNDNSDFEARIIPIPQGSKKVNNNVTTPRFYRPLYTADELQIKEKLFVAVLTSADNLDELGTAVEKTMGKHFPEIIYFSSGKPKTEPVGFKLVAFDDKNPEKLPIYVLTYIKNNLPEVYDFYLFVTDRTYLRAQRYLELVKHISVTQDVYMGAVGRDRRFCALNGGILLSYSIIYRVLTELPWCTLKVQPGKPGVTLGKCIHLASKKFCVPWAGDQKLMFYRLDKFNFDTDIDKLKTDPYFNNSLTFYPMPNDISFYKLHRYFCTLELTLVQKRIAAAKADIVNISKFAPGGQDSLSWPIGTREPYNAMSRFSVIQWTYFTETQMFLDNELTNVEEISGAHKQDITDIKRDSMEHLNKKYNSRYDLEKIVNGYRKFDPTRGMEYILDLLLLDKTKNNEKSFKRVHLVRPIGKVEFIQRPHVTENKEIHIILPLRPEHVDYFEMFLYTYAHSCIETKEQTSLIVAFLYPTSRSSLQNDPFQKSKSAIDNIYKKYNTTKTKLYWKALENIVTDLDLIDNLQNDFQTDNLILTITVNSELSPNFTSQYLNRVRLNTIPQTQVFFPMGFWQFRPNIIYDKKPFPASVEIGQRLGLYKQTTVDTASFYLSDYQTARKALKTKPIDIFSMFISSQMFHVLQAVEPNLKFKWINLTCDHRLAEEKYQQCMDNNLEGLASQHHLAKLINEFQSGKLSNQDNPKVTTKKAVSTQTPPRAVTQNNVTLHNLAPFMLKTRRVPSPKYKMEVPKLKLQKINFEKSQADPLSEGMLLVNPKKPIRV